MCSRSSALRLVAAAAAGSLHRPAGRSIFPRPRSATSTRRAQSKQRRGHLPAAAADQQGMTKRKHNNMHNTATTDVAHPAAVHTSTLSAHSTVARPLIPASTLSLLETLLAEAVSSAQAAGELPPHEWTPFTVSVMSSVRPTTHYTASVIKNVHAYNLAHGHSTSAVSGAKAKKKRKVLNEQGEWIVVKPNDKAACDAFDAAQAAKATAAASSAGATASAASSSVDDGDTPMATADSHPSAATPAASAASSTASPSAPPGNAYAWALSIQRHLQQSLSSSENGRRFKEECDVLVEVPEEQASIRGGGFIDFTLKSLRPEGSAAAASSGGTVIAAASSSTSSSSVAPSLATASSFSFASIGTISSVYKLKYGTPRQGTIAPASRGSLTLNPSLPPSSLDGLEEYSHLWLVFIFHKNDNKKWRPKIEPPRAGGRKMGVFATRTPHRINPVGLSLVKLERIEGRTLYLSALDLIQGTPILDIKPYHPADCMPEYTIPAWMREQAVEKPPFDVIFTQEAEEQLNTVVEGGQMEFYHTVPESREAIRESVSLDPRPIYVRARAAPEEVYGFRLDRLNVLYRVSDEKMQVEVCKIEYVDYDKVLEEQRTEAEMDTTEQSASFTTTAAASSSSSSKPRKSGGKCPSNSSTAAAADEDLITKKFLQQREKRAATTAPAAAPAASLENLTSDGMPK